MTDVLRTDLPLTGRVALVAGATRGCGRALAVELARAGAHVYATGRSSRTTGRSEIDRPETIEGTGDLVATVGEGSALVVDHEDSAAVGDLVARIERDHGRLDVLVNDVFGGDRYAEFGSSLWDHDVEGGWRMMQMGVRTHLVTAHHALPLLIRTGSPDAPALLVEMTDGTFEANREYRRGVGLYYDLVKSNVQRIVVGLTAELEDHPVTALAVTPGWLRSENMLEHFGVREDNWRDALDRVPGFAISESPTYVARGVAALAADPGHARHAGRGLSAHDLAVAYDVNDTDGSRPDAWRLIADHGFDHADVDVASYR